MSEQSVAPGDLTKLMLFFGRISEVHMDNLKSFPFIYFNDISEVTFDYSVETTDKTKPSIFSYDISLDVSTNNELPKRYKAIEAAVRALFWKEARVAIKLNGQEVYESE